MELTPLGLGNSQGRPSLSFLVTIMLANVTHVTREEKEIKRLPSKQEDNQHTRSDCLWKNRKVFNKTVQELVKCVKKGYS